MISNGRILAFVAICVCVALPLAEGQVAFNGTCPDVSVVPNFNVTAYMGLWYQVARYPNWFEIAGKCTTAEYELLDNGTVGVVNTNYNIIFRKTVSINGTAEAVDNGKLLVQFPGTPTATGSNYWVLDTDYTNYSVVYSCSNLTDSTSAKFVWILSRERFPSVATTIQTAVTLTLNNVSLNYLNPTDQNNCK